MKIDKINVKGTPYEINLPTNATPSIQSLTITGDLMVNGNSNLAVVNINSGLNLNYELPTTDFSRPSLGSAPSYYLLLEKNSQTTITSPVTRSICKSKVEFTPLYWHSVNFWNASPYISVYFSFISTYSSGIAVVNKWDELQKAMRSIYSNNPANTSKIRDIPCSGMFKDPPSSKLYTAMYIRPSNTSDLSVIQLVGTDGTGDYSIDLRQTSVGIEHTIDRLTMQID